MNDWIETARQILHRSLKPVPQELNEIDWKTDISNKPEKLAQHISAYANTPNGGYLVYGITDEGVPFSLQKGKMDEIVKKISNIGRHNLNPPIGIEHECIEYEGESILIIHIPEHNEKPVHIRSKDIYESFKRSGAQTVKISKREVRHLISISDGMEYESQTAMRDVSEDDLIRLLDFDSYFTLHEKRLPDTKLGILKVLAEEDLIKSSKKLNWDILNLGAVLFSRDLRKFSELKRKALRVIIYKDSNRINAIKEQPGIKGYASGFEGLINYVLDQLPTNEIIENALRRNVKVYPEVAIREFVANALIHQDFSITGTGVMIEIFNDRLEITNPGVPLVDVNRFIDTAPKSRNEKLASLMRRLNICEERGSGIDRAINAIEVYQLPAPKIEKGDDYTRVTLYMPQNLSSMSSEDRIRACYQHACLQYVSNQPANNQSVRRRFNISKNNTSMASKIIAETIESGLLKARNPENASKKYASYVPYWA